MAPEIPGQFNFEHLLAHTFPGFFSAITLFMLIDVLSPIDLTAWAIKDVEGLAVFIGFVILIGTILGVMIDGLHHSIIEENIFANFIGAKVFLEFIKSLYPRTDISVKRSYFFKESGAIQVDEYMTNKMYRYSEFYANTFISLIPFSVIIPFYLFDVLQIPWSDSLSLALMSFIIACVILNSSYNSFISYLGWNLSATCGYLGCGSYVHVEKINGCPKSEATIEERIEARIVDRVSQRCMPKNDIEVNFKTTLGEISPVTTTTKCGIAITTLLGSYLFNWDDVPGSDKKKLIEFLKQTYDIDWVKTAKIEKIDDKTRRIFTEKNSISLKLNYEKTEVNLKIDDIRTDKLIVKDEKGKLNIYLGSNHKKNGIAIVTATSKDCIPGVTKVRLGGGTHEHNNKISGKELVHD